MLTERWLTGRWLITGGSGYLGRGILRRARREGWPAEFTVYSRDEGKQAAMRRRFPEARYVLGDVRDGQRLAASMAGHDGVVHAGAVKRIPEAEHNVFECIDVNVGGSREVVVAAARANIQRVIGLSTDKACSPLNTYGMTKALMERIFAQAATHWPTHYACVRYGNVVSSSGSVVPLFRQQAQDYGELRVTDDRMTRFWLSVDEAISLICVAAAAGEDQRGTVFVPRCGAMRIVDVARVAAPECPIRVTGMRPGEKLHESLVIDAELPRTEERLGGYVIYPPTVVSLRESATAPYSSDAPDHWITLDRMAEMIADAEDLEA